MWAVADPLFREISQLEPRKGESVKEMAECFPTFLSGENKKAVFC